MTPGAGDEPVPESASGNAALLLHLRPVMSGGVLIPGSGVAGALAWLALAGRISVAEGIVACAAGAACAALAAAERDLVRGVGMQRAGAVLRTLPARVLIDLVVLAGALPRRPRGRRRSRRLSSPDAAWRAFAALAASLPPNSLTVGVGDEQIDLHELVPDPPGPEPRW